MKRRHMLLAAAIVLAGPFHVRAQTARVPKIGVLILDKARAEAFRAPFLAGLRDHGYVEGRNVAIEWREADGSWERQKSLAAELVRMKVDVIVATPLTPVKAAKEATSTIPIVMAGGGDPVAAGFVKSLSRPTGNVTGLSNVADETAGKLLELVRQLRPRGTKVALLGASDSADAFLPAFLKQLQAASSAARLQIQPVLVAPEDLDAAFARMARERMAAVIIQPSYANKRAAELALKYRLPSISTGTATRIYPNLGGLMTYGANPADSYRRAADYVDKILKGAKAADIPIQQPVNFELIVNTKTAVAIGVTIPPSLLLRAERVIE